MVLYLYCSEPCKDRLLLQNLAMLLALRLPHLYLTCLAAQRMAQRQQVSRWATHIMRANRAHKKRIFAINIIAIDITAALSEAALQDPHRIAGTHR